MQISYHKRTKTPKYTDDQALRAKMLSRKLVNHLYGKKGDIVIDDEKYFLFNGMEMPGNAEIYTNNIDKCSENVKYAGKEKFPSKVFVWLSISNVGILTPLILKTKSCSIKSDLYIEE